MTKNISTHKRFIRKDREDFIWCPGCGITPALTCFTKALDKMQVDPDKIVVVSGIGCAGRIAGYINCDSFHTTHGRAIPFATGVKLANPDLKVVVFSGDGDLFAIGGNHFIHAARRNIDITVLCINNFVYAMTGGQWAPSSINKEISSKQIYSEPPFNLPNLAQSSGAVYVARWSTYHPKDLTDSIMEGVQKRGFSFIEILSPCPPNHQGKNKKQTIYKNTCVKNYADTADVSLQKGKETVLGKFIDISKPTFSDYQK